MTGKQKIYFLLNKLDDIRQITPSGEPLLVHPGNNLENNYTVVELRSLFQKLEKDEKILKVVKELNRRAEAYRRENDIYDPSDVGCWHIGLLPAFNKYYLKIQQEPEYQEFTGKKPNTPKPIDKTAKHSRKALEKIWNVLQEIEDKRGITSSRDDIHIQQLHWSKVKNDNEAKDASNERRTILKKLEKDDNAIRDVYFPNSLHDFISLKTSTNYRTSYDYYENEYKKVAKEYQKKGQVVTTSHNNLSLLHPDIFSKCQSLFQKAEYPEAVEKGFKVVRDRLRDLTNYETGSEAFGKGKLHIKGATAPNVDGDFNQAVKFLTMAIDMFRNEKSHTSNAKIDNPQRAYEYLTLSSLAMNLLDQAEIITT